MGRTCYSYGGTEPYKKSSCCSGGRKKTKRQTETKMGRWCDGRCQEVGGEKLEECCKEQGQLAETSEECLGSKGALVPMVMMIQAPRREGAWVGEREVLHILNFGTRWL
jgi:hypothetical protein